MSDNTGAPSGDALFRGGPDANEPPAGQGILGTNALQSSLDSNTRAVSSLGADMSNLAARMGNPPTGTGPTSSGFATGAQNRGTGATGTDRQGGGYAAMVKGFLTFGAGGAGGTVGSGGGTVGGSGGRGMATFGAGGGVNGAPGGSGGGWRGALSTGAEVMGIAAGYGNANMNSFMTMNTAATQAMWRSGLAAGGVNQSLGAATRMVFGTAGGFQNVTATGVGDAAAANNILGYTSGIGMYGAGGAPNAQYLAAQNSMFSLGYANPYMTQTQVAAGMQQIYSPNSIRAMTALGVKLPAGQVAPQTVSPMAIAQSVFSRTFGGASSVNAATMTAATGQGGSLNANLAYLGQQAGWSSSTVQSLETYLQQRNNAIQRGMSPGQVDSLLSQASTGNKQAASQLAAVGIGSSTVQSVKSLQAAQTSNLADQSGSFNDALQTSTSLLTDFNQVLGQILSSTGLSGAMGSTAGYSSMFGGIAGAASYMAGSGGYAGGGGSFGGIGANIAGNYAMGRAAKLGSKLFGKAGSALKSRFGTAGESVAAGEGEAAAVEGGAAEAVGGMSLGTGVGLGLGAAYLGAHANNALWGAVGHTGSGDDWVTDVGKGAGNTLAYAGAGALIGSVIPGVGTLAGGIVGGAIGIGQSIWDWVHDKSGYSAANTASSTGANTAPAVTGGYSSGYGGYTTGSIGGGTDEGTTGTAGPSSATPALGASNAGASTVARVVAAAVAQVGKPYVYGATGPDSFDCSGLMQWSYKQGGITLPRTSEQQMGAGTAVKPSEALPGDLLFPYPGHVMMCIGGGKVVEARHTGTTIWVRSYSPSEFIAARRIVSVGTTTGQNAAASGGNAASNPGANIDAMGQIAGAGGAGTSELEAISANAMAATTDKVTAALQVGAANTPFGTASLTSSMADANPNAGTAAGAAGPSGSTPLNGTVKDRYGHTYKVPTGTKPSGSVASWINTALSDMGMAASPDAVGDIKDIITGESSGDPWSINLYDSNAAAGHPSEGIMQTIPSTFAAYAMGGHKDIWNPVDNIIAGVRYAIATYKSLDNVPGVKAVKAGKPYVGYAAGAWELADDQVASLHKGEMVLPKAAAQSVRNAVIADALGQNAAKQSTTAGGVTLNFRPGAIQVSIGGQVTSGTAQQAATAIVDGITSDPRIKAMAVGL